MKAVAYLGPSRLAVADKPVPRIEHPRDAVMRVTRAAICGSDLHLYHGLVPDTRVGTTFVPSFLTRLGGPAARRHNQVA